ncbi:hypothetical protein V8E54_013397 [Elaphomyces granulatus]
MSCDGDTKEHHWRKALIIVGTLLLFLWFGFANLSFSSLWTGYQTPTVGCFEKQDSTNWCPLPEDIAPRDDGLKGSDHLNTPEVIARQVERLSLAVSMPTENFDDNGDVDEDPRWATFDKFHEVLKKLFPLVHKNFALQKVNRYGLLYTLKGTNSSLKPILLTAHQDVVPAGPASSWTHPPFSPYYDGDFLWGRGSTDCKNVLIGIMSALEDILSQSFVPHRTIVLAFGFDEETGGVRGAATLAKTLLKEWGNDSFVLILDEGGMEVQTLGDVMYALPAVAEKGYHDVRLTLRTTGGHSSTPPPHTGIGIMAQLVVALEKEPYVPRLTQTNPFRRVQECKAKYSPDRVQPWLKSSLESGDEERIARKLAENAEAERWLMQTSQAVDLITGGIKVNALPELVEVLVNHRIAPHQSIEWVNEHIKKVLTPLAEGLGIEVIGPDDMMSISNNLTLTSQFTTGKLTFSYPHSLEVAPISPTKDSSVWALFGGTIRYVFENTDNGRGKTVVPVGGIMTGNTDTQHYWNLTRNIYRFSPVRKGARFNAHTVDERMEMKAHVEGMRLYYGM